MYRKSNRKIIAVAAGLTLSFLLSLHNPPKSRAAEEVCPADAKVANFDFTFKDINGKNVALSAYKGKVVLLDFWATYCLPCKDEIPFLNELYKTYRDKGLEVIGVSIEGVGEEVIRPFAEMMRISYSIFLGGDDIIEAYDIQYIPLTYILGKDGRVRMKEIGFKKEVSIPKFKRQVEELLKEG